MKVSFPKMPTAGPKTELSQEFYPRPDGQPWKINYDDALEALNQAKQRLMDTR